MKPMQGNLKYEYCWTNNCSRKKECQPEEVSIFHGIDKDVGVLAEPLGSVVAQ